RRAEILHGWHAEIVGELARHGEVEIDQRLPPLLPEQPPITAGVRVEVRRPSVEGLQRLPVLVPPRLRVVDAHVGKTSAVLRVDGPGRPRRPIRALDTVAVLPVAWGVLNVVQIDEQIAGDNPREVTEPRQVARLTDANDHCPRDTCTQ